MIVGRKTEVDILFNALNSKRSELIAVYGRRRIGKTFLIRNVYRKYLKFEFSGIHKATLNDQLSNFYFTLSSKLKNEEIPTSWIEAFFQLSKYLDKLSSREKKVIFIDEFPWLDSRKSKFLPAFEHFWNAYASKRNDMVVVICGSAASYMMKNIIRSKGGLHNRLTYKIQLGPFNLFESEKLLRHNQVKLSRYDILQIYMSMGGVPFYLEQIQPGESAAQSIDRLFFSKDGILRSEFNNVFASLFNHSDNHESIVSTLAKVRKGLTRNNIQSKSKVKSGGTLSKTLLELEESGFIEKYSPFKGIKDSLYRLTDEYSMFYIKYVQNSKPLKKGSWNKLSGQQSFKIWSGFSFETVCMKHIDQILEGLKISGINSTYGSWMAKGGTNNAQIDLLIDRDDNVINLCEIKFYNTEYTINKKYAHEIASKLNTFIEQTKTKKSVFVTFITTYGLNGNQYSRQYVQNELTMNHLFIEL